MGHRPPFECTSSAAWSRQALTSKTRFWAKRYHPDQGNRNSHELMAHINAARTVILNAHSFDEDRPERC
jgi:hypothetical protein